MKLIVNLLLFCLCICINFVFGEKGTYRAAVVAYTPDLTASKPLDRLYTNVASYLSFIEQAGAKNADIIVFPEDGLTGWYDVITFPEIVELVSTQVPDPILNDLPCTSSNKKYSKVFKDFSCAALKNKLYVVVNLVEQYYDKNRKNYTYFNTNVVFDKNGCVVSRYRKINLLNENLFLRGNSTESFKSDFGVTFGVYTCFDIVFKQPALNILDNPEVTDIIYPVAWFSHLPFLQGMSVHHGYVVSTGVNLLAAGLHDPPSRNGGTAIYLADGKILKEYISGHTGSKLIIGDVPKISSRKFDQSCQVVDQYSESTQEELADITKFTTSVENMSNYTFKLVDLSKQKITETVCSGESFCCTFDLTVDATSKSNYVYKLIAYHGTVELSLVDRLGTRSCALVACKNQNDDSCGKRHKEPPAGISFKNIEVTGVFKSSNAHYQPSTLTYALKPMTNYTFCKSQKGNDDVEIKVGTTKEQNLLLTFGIYGRVFSDDGKPVGVIQ